MQLWPRSSRLLSYSVITASLCLSPQIKAQTTSTGALTGVITDQTHAVVPNAKVELKDKVKGAAQSTKTDREGLYHFFFLAPGTYTLAVTHDGFREERRTVDVLLGPPVTVNVTLAVAKSSTEITVADAVPLIQAENGDASANINQQQISEIPTRVTISPTLSKMSVATTMYAESFPSKERAACHATRATKGHAWKVPR